MSETTATPPVDCQSPPPAPQPPRQEPDPARELHELARQLVANRNRRQMLQYLRLRRQAR
jgi:hypothetical protein